MCDLDEENKKWLSSQFTVESAADSRPGSLRLSEPLPTIQDVAEDGSADGDAGAGGGESPADIATWGAAAVASAAAGDAQEQEVFYVDNEGELQGPFTLMQLRTWQLDGYLDDELQVRVGADGEFAPLQQQMPVMAGMLLRELAVGTARAKDESEEANVSGCSEQGGCVACGERPC